MWHIMQTLTTDDAVWHDEIVYTCREHGCDQTEWWHNSTESAGQTGSISVV